MSTETLRNGAARAAPLVAGTARYYRPELDALRFFAFCMVFCHHVRLPFSWWPMLVSIGGFGLPLFFLLSAYLIVTLLLREKEKFGRIDVPSFFVRRALRIWPLYFALLLLGLVVGHFYAPVHLPHGAYLALAFLVGNVWLIRHGWLLNWANPLWSISVEEQFYLVVPWALQAVKLRRDVMVAGCVCVLLLSYGALVWLGLHRADPTLQIWCNSLVQFQFFAAGALVAMWHLDRRLECGGRTRAALLLGGLLLWFLAARFGHLYSGSPLPLSRLLPGFVCVLVGTTSLFTGVLDTSARIPEVLRYLGKISFGLYVFHNIWPWVIGQRAGYLLTRWPVQFVALSAVATLLCATLSYRYFESPFLRLKHRFEKVRTRPV